MLVLKYAKKQNVAQEFWSILRCPRRQSCKRTTAFATFFSDARQDVDETRAALLDRNMPRSVTWPRNALGRDYANVLSGDLASRELRPLLSRAQQPSGYP
jgi:hypothetical protein